MKRSGFFSNLVYALRKRLGWCPEPPAPKDVFLQKMALNKGMVYEEKPFSWYIFMRPFSWWLAATFFSFIPNIFSNFIGLSVLLGFIVLGAINFAIYILGRKILFTPAEFRIQLGLNRDTIKIYEIKSVEYVGKKRPWKDFSTWEGFWNWGGWNLPPFFGVGGTKPKSEQEPKYVRWYIFGEGRHYFKIEKLDGNAVCIGVKNPNEFMNKWKMLQSKQEISLDTPQRVCVHCSKPISFGEGWTEKENKPYHLACWASKRTYSQR